MPDEDEGLLEQLGDLANDAILVETLMGWDGDPCLCEHCDCPRFRDGGITDCPECAAGRHFHERGGLPWKVVCAPRWRWCLPFSRWYWLVPWSSGAVR